MIQLGVLLTYMPHFHTLRVYAHGTNHTTPGTGTEFSKEILRMQINAFWFTQLHERYGKFAVYHCCNFSYHLGARFSRIR